MKRGSHEVLAPSSRRPRLVQCIATEFALCSTALLRRSVWHFMAFARRFQCACATLLVYALRFHGVRIAFPRRSGTALTACRQSRYDVSIICSFACIYKYTNRKPVRCMVFSWSGIIFLAHQTEIATLFAWVIKLHLTQVFSPRLKNTQNLEINQILGVVVQEKESNMVFCYRWKFPTLRKTVLSGTSAEPRFRSAWSSLGLETSI